MSALSYTNRTPSIPHPDNGAPLLTLATGGGVENSAERPCVFSGFLE